MCRIFAAVAVIATALLSSVPASANKPAVVEDVTIVESFEVPAEEFVCDVDVSVELTLKVRVTEHLDKDGNVLRVRAHLNGTERVSSENATLVDRWTQVDFFDPAELTVTTAGNPWNVHLPGSGTGVLVNDSGLITFDVTNGDVLFVAGPHPAFFGPEAFDEACAILEGAS